MPDRPLPETFTCGRCETIIRSDDTAARCTVCHGPLCLPCLRDSSYCLKPECQRVLADLDARAGKRAN